MKKHAIIARAGCIIPALIAVLSIAAAAFQWPLKDHRVTATFAESRWDHFHSGIDLVNVDGSVRPVDNGTLEYFWEKSIFPLENYPGGGNYKIIAHKNSLRSIYMHLEDSPGSTPAVTTDSRIAVMGNTGHSLSKHLHVSLYDSRKGMSINPLNALPKSDDASKPEIGEMAIRIGEKVVIVKNNADIRLTRHYPLMVAINDTISGRERLGVYRFQATFNDKKVMDMKFNDIRFDGKLAKVSGRTFVSIFDEKGYYKIEGIEYRAGENTLRVTATDFAGNSVEKDFTFNVKLDMPDKK